MIHEMSDPPRSRTPADDDPEPSAMGPAPDVAGRERIRAGARAKLFGEPPPPGSAPAPSKSPPAEPTTTDPPRIGRFTVIDRLGAGGMGVVYRAYDPELDRRVAIKLIRPDLADETHGSAGASRLQREAQAMARLNHPNVVTVHEVGRHRDQVFVAMEFVSGGTLRQWAQGRDWQDVVEAYCHAANGLCAAHDAGIIHRDFKPDNVMVGDDGRVRVMDFGLSRTDRARGVEGPTEKDASPALLDVPLTQTGALMGTPAYMAPEQHDAGEVTVASDQFSFCVSLWESLTAQRPFAGRTYGELVGNVVTGKLSPIPSSATAPRRIFDILTRGLAVDPAERYPSMLALRAALRADPTRWLRRLGVGLALGGIAVAGVWWAMPEAPDPSTACDDAGEAMATLWSDAQRSKTRTALTSDAAPYADASWTTVEGMLDTYARQWTDAAGSVCATKLVSKGEDETLLRREQCLQTRRSDMAQLVAMLSSSEEGLALQAVQAVATLSPIEGCNDPRRLEAFSIRRDPQTVTELSQARAGLARAKAHGGLGRYPEAIREADVVVSKGRSLDDPATEAAGLLVRGQYEERSGDRNGSEQTLRAAIHKAEIAHDHTTRALALIRLIYVVGSDSKRYDEAVALGADAGAVLRMLGADPLLQAKLDMNLGGADRAARKLPEALAHYRSALSIYTKLYGDTHPETARALTSLGSVLITMGEIDDAIEALERARVSFERSLGREHPFVAVVMGNLGTAQGEQKDYEGAIDTLTRALELRRRSDGPEHPGVAKTLFNLGNIQYRAGRYDDAIESLRTGQAILAKSDPPRQRLARYQFSIGAAQLAAGRMDEARASLDPLLELFPIARGPAGNYGRRLRYLLAIAHIEDDLARARMWTQMSLDNADPGDSYFDRLQGLLWLIETVQYGPNLRPTPPAPR